MKNRRFLVFTALLGALTLAAAPTAAQNLVTNSTFDTDITGWEGDIPANAVFLASDGSTLTGGSGPGCLEVRNDEHTGGSSKVWQRVTPTSPGGKEYEFEVSVYFPSTDNPADQVYVSISWISEYGWSMGRKWLYIPSFSRDTWVRLSDSGIAPADTVAMDIELRVSNPDDSQETGTGTAYYDDVWVAEKGATVATQELFVPVAASKAGKKGTYWTSDLWITSLIDFPVTLEGAVLLTDTDNSAAVATPTTLATIPARGFVKLQDVIATLGMSVTGGLYLKASAQAAGLPATLIVVASRNSTPDPGSTGSYGQGMPAVGAGTKGVVVAPGVFENSAWRTNVGVVNTSATTVEVKVEVMDSTGSVAGYGTWTMKPYAHRMVSVTTLGVTTLDGGTVVFTRESTGGSFRGFTSIADNVSGDSVYCAAQ